MESSRVSRKHYLLALAVVFTSVAFAAVCALGYKLMVSGLKGFHGYGSVIAIMVGPGVAFAASMWVVFWVVFMRKPSQRANYPRVEHLRIAGKYAPAGASKVGVTPLHLK
jgi:hypothetical protein